MWNKNKQEHNKPKQPAPPFPAFLKSPLVELYQQQIDNVRELLTEQDTLFTGIADTYEQTAIGLTELALLTRSDPAKAEHELLRLAQALPVAAQKIRTGRDMTRQVLTNIGGRTDGKQ